MTPDELLQLVAHGETLTIEFKSDRGPLPDSDLVESVVCLANHSGGKLLIGVEDNGQISGLHASHRPVPNPGLPRSSSGALAAFIAARTVPPLAVEVDFVDVKEKMVAVLSIAPAKQPVATSDGRVLIRYLDVHAQPGCRPLYPYELSSWRADHGQNDLSALLAPDATWEDLDIVEFARLKRMVAEYNGDQVLLDLSNERIAAALGFAQPDENGALRPSLCGLLMVGKEAALRRHLPAHEVAFQVLHGTDVTVNEFRRWPLLRIYEWFTQAIDIRNEEQEILYQGVRVGVPRYDRRGIREAINNALIHRDYTQLGAVHIQLHDQHLRVVNPGGFPAGVQLDNLLSARPRARNPLLADAFKRIGLVERSGRGLSIIFQGQARNGRAAPNYARSDTFGVTVLLDSSPPDIAFVEMTLRVQQRLERALHTEELIVLWQLWHDGVTPASQLEGAIPPGETLADMLREGLIQARGDMYDVSADLKPAERRSSLSPETMILDYTLSHGQITRREAAALLGLNTEQARYHLEKLVKQGLLQRIGQGRGAAYRPSGKHQINGE
ncbi:MAG: putative DNA binding domain-containing protein [Chloroflexi bacterium]|nr:putative DNA binding domain-containing protein [Chloroflexota bacterium]